MGSDPSDVNIKNTEKISDVVANMQTDSKHRGSSAAESQGIDNRIICIFLRVTGLTRSFCDIRSSPSCFHTCCTVLHYYLSK